MSISIEALKQAIKIKEQIADLEAQLAKILNGGQTQPPTPAKRGRKKAQAATDAPEVPAAKPLKKARKPKRQMSEEGRKRISEAAKARWASRRKA